jgi:hypothetical protein
MDTYEARTQMLELAREALGIVESLEANNVPTGEDKRRLRSMQAAARSALADAGYPAEAVWRGLQRASMGTDTSLDHADPMFWHDVADELRDAMETLESLLSPHFRRESDFYIVG